MSAHAPLAPSFAPVWAFCSGAPSAAAQFPNAETEDSRNGTAAHWVFSETCLNIRDERVGPWQCHEFVGQTAPNGVVIDGDMAEGAQVMVDDVMGVAEHYGLVRHLLIEQKVNMPSVHATLNYGTLDAALIVPGQDGRPYKIYIWDYKHGRRIKRAEGNYQLIDYLEGVASGLGVTGVEDPHIAVSMRIVQPYAYRPGGPVDEWVGVLADLRGHVNVLTNQAEQAFTRPTLTAGPHCRDCPANGSCSAARKNGYLLDEITRQPYAMDDMTPAELATERNILKGAIEAAKGRLETIEDTLTNHLKSGRSEGTGLKLEVSHGRTKYVCDPEVAIALAAQFGADIRKPAALTPKQSIARVDKARRPFFEQAIQQFVETPTTGMKIINAADSKTAAAFKRK